MHTNRLRLKIVTKGKGKDVLWGIYTLRFTNLKSFSDCQAAAEELFRVDSVNERQREVIPLSLFNPDPTEILEVHVVPSDEVSIVPPPPTVTNVLFP